MVGRLNDIVTAAVVVGATEKVNMGRNRDSNSVQSSAQLEDVQSAATANNNRVVMKPHEIQPEDENIFQRDEDTQEDFHLEPGSVDEETVSFMTQELNDLMNKINCNLEFSYHQFEKVMSVSMVDKETKEVIKEMPPEEMIEGIMKARIWLGAFIDKTF